MYDLIILGAGTAGITAYQEAVKHTPNLLIINQGPWDTTCARVGCMPSKVLISTANRMHQIVHADQVALNVEAKIDTTNVMTHVRQLRDRFTQATLKQVAQWPDQHKISGQARFINTNTIEVHGQCYQAKAFILAVGSTPTLNIEWKKLLQDRYITSDDIFELKQLPKSLAVIGSGVIAIELAQAMARLGVKVTVFARSQKVGNLTSPTLQTLAQTTLGQELDIKFKTLPESVERIGNQVEIKYLENGAPKSLSVDYLFTATGRQSNLSTLQLENIQPEWKDVKQLPIDATTKQLGDLPIFIVGDAATDRPIQHEAAFYGKRVIQNALNYPNIQAIQPLTALSIVFSAPEMAMVGKNYKQLTTEHHAFITGHVSYEKQGRALVLGENQGGIEVYVDTTTSKLLGAELFCPGAEHLAHLLTWMMDEELTIHQILEKPFYHPTLEEGLRTALKHARRQLK